MAEGVTPRVVVPLALGGADRAWRFLLDLANDPHVPPWVLVGGLMVELHAYEQGVVPVRVTNDADVLVDLFTDPAGTERVAAALVDRYGLSFDTPGPDGVGHRFRDGDLVVDVLAPDRLGPRTTTRTVPPAHTVRVPAGRRLLRDAEPVVVSYDGHESVMRRPRLIAAIIGKTRAHAVDTGRERERHLDDLALLAGLITDPVAVAGRLTRGERAAMRAASALLPNSHPSWRRLPSPADARAALRLLAHDE